jgi:hypothetical protein
MNERKEDATTATSKESKYLVSEHLAISRGDASENELSRCRW